MSRRRAPLPALVVALGLFLCAAPAALADTTESSNWAGYAAHGKGVSFRNIYGAWRQPSADCTPGQKTYSSYWVGIGGYAANSDALEQIGSEVDCTFSGRVDSSAWFEIVPAPSRTLSMEVNPGDLMTASVFIRGHEVTLSLRDVTRHRSFKRTVRIGTLDLSSAEWIVEAPSSCNGANSCSELPLADFGSARFTGASATSSAGHRGAIVDQRWNTTEIVLASGGKTFVSNNGQTTATPSTLVAGGSAFSVLYSASGGSSASSNGRRTASVLTRAGRALQPGGLRR